jgi:hypothetical protein
MVLLGFIEDVKGIVIAKRYDSSIFINVCRCLCCVYIVCIMCCVVFVFTVGLGVYVCLLCFYTDVCVAYNFIKK